MNHIETGALIGVGGGILGRYLRRLVGERFREVDGFRLLSERDRVLPGQDGGWRCQLPDLWMEFGRG